MYANYLVLFSRSFMPDLPIKEMNTLLLLVLCCCAIIGVSSSRILLSAPLGSKSHQNMYIPLIKELAKRNHQVTFITNFESSDLREMSDRVHQIVIPQLIIENSNQMPNTFETILAGEWFDWKGFYIMMKVIISMTKQSTELMYDLPQVKKMIKEEKFDLVIVSSISPASYAFAWHYKTPVILISPGPLLTGMSSFLGADENFSYVPFWMSNFSDRMTFYQRVMNLLISKIFNYVTLESQLPVYLSIIRERVLPDCPPLDQIEKESVGLILTNSHPVFNYPRSLAPQVIEVGGSHCRQPKPLDTELEEFVSGSEAGFIVFGVGSYQRMDDMPEKLIQPFIKAFSRIPQRVVWQWKGKPRADFPKNVLAMPWLPQQDLLGHKKCRLFMTHGGLNGLQETIYHGVPILGLPLGADQTLNIMRAARDGYGLKLDWKDVTEETLNEALQSLLHNPSYTKSVKELSALFRDQIQPPLERAVYWTEFVLRHNGTDHLILGSKDLHPLQRSLVDVYLILFLVGLTPLLMTIFCVRMCCCRRRTASKPKTALKPEAKGTGKGPTKADQKKRQ